MRTKIVCTLGPASDSEEVIRAMIKAGMDVARLNFSHGTREDHSRRVAHVRRLAQEAGATVALMGDLQGPKFRVGKLPDDGLELAREAEVVLSDHAALGEIPLPHPDLLMALQIGQRVLIDDGAISLLVTRKIDDTTAGCIVITGGKLTSNKGVSAPGVQIATSSLTPKDREDLVFAVELGLDALALSFVRSAADVRELRHVLREHGGDPLIISKIEKPEAMDDLAAIVRESDGVMVARGDLGVEAAPEEVPFFQKRIIATCLRAGKPVITATQMLQSMIVAPQPTRAEASDVANAVLDGTDAVMLSGETAMGAYPVLAVEAMARIAARAEQSATYRTGALSDEARDGIAADDDLESDHKTDAFTTAAVRIARTTGSKAIVCATSSGFTARMVSRHRPTEPILCLTPHHRTQQYSAFMWGVSSVIVETRTGDDAALYAAACAAAQQLGYATPGDHVVITAGLPLGSGPGHTNSIRLVEVAS